MARVTIEDMARIAREDVPLIGNLGLVFEHIGDGVARARLPVREEFLRPGGTVNGPILMAVADFVIFACVLSRIGIVKMTATTTLNANFLRRPPALDLIAAGRLIKCGNRLAYGELTITSDGEPDDPVFHATATYSIPRDRR